MEGVASLGFELLPKPVQPFTIERPPNPTLKFWKEHKDELKEFLENRIIKKQHRCYNCNKWIQDPWSNDHKNGSCMAFKCSSNRNYSHFESEGFSGTGTTRVFTKGKGVQWTMHIPSDQIRDVVKMWLDNWNDFLSWIDKELGVHLYQPQTLDMNKLNNEEAAALNRLLKKAKHSDE